MESLARPSRRQESERQPEKKQGTRYVKERQPEKKQGTRYVKERQPEKKQERAFSWLSLGFPLAFAWLSCRLALRESQGKAKRKPRESQTPRNRAAALQTRRFSWLFRGYPLARKPSESHNPRKCEFHANSNNKDEKVQARHDKART